MIETITILGGYNRSGVPEAVERIDLRMGDVVSIVGPTGSGKTTLINDLELFADANTQTGRRVLINNERPPLEYRDNTAMNPIALITQHTTFLSDLPVQDFLTAHAGIRAVQKSQRTLPGWPPSSSARCIRSSAWSPTPSRCCRNSSGTTTSRMPTTPRCPPGIFPRSRGST